jgi:1-acyl-sn-glycerol-3-phosphate acyltransferase
MVRWICVAVGAVAFALGLRRWRRQRPRYFDDRPMSVALFKAVCKPVLHAAVDITVEGPVPDGGAVLASNHPNYLDGPLMMAVDDRIRPVAKPQGLPLVRAGLRLSGSILVGRHARHEAAAHLRRGGQIWVAPEGHMTGERLGPLRPGPARIAVSAGVPLVPVAIRYRHSDGTAAGPGPVGTVGPRLRGWRPWRRPGVRVVFGAPIWPQSGSESAAMTELREVLSVLADVPMDDDVGGAVHAPPGRTTMSQ